MKSLSKNLFFLIVLLLSSCSSFEFHFKPKPVTLLCIGNSYNAIGGPDKTIFCPDSGVAYPYGNVIYPGATSGGH